MLYAWDRRFHLPSESIDHVFLGFRSWWLQICEKWSPIRPIAVLLDPSSINVWSKLPITCTWVLWSVKVCLWWPKLLGTMGVFGSLGRPELLVCLWRSKKDTVIKRSDKKTRQTLTSTPHFFKKGQLPYMRTREDTLCSIIKTRRGMD